MTGSEQCPPSTSTCLRKKLIVTLLATVSFTFRKHGILSDQMKKNEKSKKNKKRKIIQMDDGRTGN